MLQNEALLSQGFFQPYFDDHPDGLLAVDLQGRVQQFRHKNGEYRLYETTSEYIRDESGEIVQTICIGRDITGRRQAEER
ncbi:PAS domain S-box-containing protein [Cohnella sp. OV330]|uniref:PAS domain S-box protein n=1 Tax=Cohnella sp. OV330 TaxID=1855288 RepID=UPI0008EAF13A|nr:PAS domain S-box protein [Cohnella sp. OV330]SFB44974.1 PAS domain S-box-containing protein [Cohnella sp. OV330]